MKKGKVLGKGQLTVAVMLVALGAAIWLNAKYLPSDTKYLGEASYVGNTSEDAVQTAAKSEEKKDDYFTEAKKEREKAKKEACEIIEETLKDEKLTEADKKSALAKIEEIGARIESESNIEALLKAKGFEKALAIMTDTGISVVVKSDGLTSAQTMQIQDVITEQTTVTLENIKIIPVK